MIPDSEKRTIKSKYVDEEFKISVYIHVRMNPTKSLSQLFIFRMLSIASGVLYTFIRRLIKGKEIPTVLLVGVAYELDYQ